VTIIPIFTLPDIFWAFSIELSLNMDTALDKKIKIAIKRTGKNHMVNIPRKYSIGLVRLANIMKDAARIEEDFIP
jgi:hypothetical protein